MIWEVDAKSQKRLNGIVTAVKGADKLIWRPTPIARERHVLEVLKERHAIKQLVERVVFNAITKTAVLDAMKHPRQIDGALVDACLPAAHSITSSALRSPVLWRKLPGARSAGVQSVALRLVATG